MTVSRKARERGFWRDVGLWLACLTLGHRWKSSSRRKPDFYAVLDAAERKELPYAVRQSGNAGLEESVGWSYKCRRCRLKVRGDNWQPWWKIVWWAFRHGLGPALLIVWECWWRRVRPKPQAGKGYAQTRWRGWFPGLLGSLAFAAAQFFGYLVYEWRWFPGWVFRPIWWLEGWGHKVEDRHSSYYKWQGPNPPEMRDGVLHVGAWVRYPSPYSGEKVNETATLGETTTATAYTSGSGIGIVVSLNLGGTNTHG